MGNNLELVWGSIKLYVKSFSHSALATTEEFCSLKKKTCMNDPVSARFRCIAFCKGGAGENVNQPCGDSPRLRL